MQQSSAAEVASNQPMEPTAYRGALFTDTVSRGFVRRDCAAAHGRRYVRSGS